MKKRRRTIFGAGPFMGREYQFYAHTTSVCCNAIGPLGRRQMWVKTRRQPLDAIREAIIALPENNRQQIEADFRDIDALASERGFRAMMDEVDWRVRNNPLQNGFDRDLTSASLMQMASTNGPCGSS
jgi:hypothetical protein